MKKFFAILITVFVLINCFVPVFATGVSDSSNETNAATSENNVKDGYETISDNAVLLNYNFSDDFEKIEINGNVSYNALIKYGKYRLQILRLAPYDKIENVILSDNADIVVEMDIAAKFDFSIKVESSSDLFSKYAVIFRADDKLPVLASPPRFVNIIAKNTSEQTEVLPYKGIALSDYTDVSVSGDMGFGSVVIPVYYNKLLSSNSKGYMYPLEDTYCYFDTAYINELDTQATTKQKRIAEIRNILKGE